MISTSHPPVTQYLAEFAADSTLDAVPADVQHAGRRTVLNAVGVAVGGSYRPAPDTALRAVRALGGSPPQASLLGRRDRLGTVHAAFINGIAAHVDDFDDTHLPTVVHPGAPIVPAALAAGERVGACGADVLAAVVIGVEVALRVADGICPEHFDRAWHLTGTAGHIGAAAAAGRLLLDRDPDHLRTALGLGATQAAGLTAALGTMTKSFHPGKAAADGVEAALLAKEGFTGPQEPIVGRRGFAPLASPRVDAQRMIEGLGARWTLSDNTFKPYACGIVSHPIIDAGIEFRERVQAGDITRDITRVEITVNPVVLEVMGVAEPTDGLQSKFSAYHCFAVGFLDGAGGPAQFSNARAVADDVVTLRRRTQVQVDPRIPKGAAHVLVETRDSGRHELEVLHARGSAERQMTDVELEDKVRLVAEPVIGTRVEELLARLWAIDTEGQLTALVEAARPPGNLAVPDLSDQREDQERV